MVKFLIVAVVAWIIGVFGWAQIIASLQNIKERSGLVITMILWIAIMGVAAFLAVAKLGELWSLIIGYGISFFQVIRSGKIE